MLKYKKNRLSWLNMRSGELKVVHDDDIDSLFQSIGYLEKYKNNELRCFNCNDTITFENFQCIIPNKDEILFCCSKEECYKKTLKIGGFE